MKRNWIPFFKTGKHKDSKGRERAWSEQQLDQAAAHFNGLPETEKAKRPLTIAHPDNNLPVMGFVEAVKRVGDTLYALPGKIADGFKDLVNAGELPERSISFFSDGTINHFGFLPKGQKAAIPNLGTFNFSAEEEKHSTYSFATGKLLEEETNEDLTELKSSVQTLLAEINKMKAAASTDSATAHHHSSDKDGTDADELKTLQGNIQKQQAKLATMEFQAKLGSNLTPAQRSLFVKAFEASANNAGANDKFEFSDGGKETPGNVLLQLAGLIENTMQFSEFATKQKHQEQKRAGLSDTEKVTEIIRASMSN